MPVKRKPSDSAITSGRKDLELPLRRAEVALVRKKSGSADKPATKKNGTGKVPRC